MKRPTNIPDETFTFRDGLLLRRVIPKRGKPYEHMCTLDTFRSVLWAGEDMADVGFTIEEIAEAEDLPHTQVAVAIAFLREYGCIERRRRRNYSANGLLYEDGMIEFMYLREYPDGDDCNEAKAGNE